VSCQWTALDSNSAGLAIGEREQRISAIPIDKQKERKMAAQENDLLESWELLVEEGENAQAQRHYNQAQAAYNLALIMAEQSTEVAPQSVHRLRLLLGGLHAEQNNHARAEDVFKCAFNRLDGQISETDKAVLFRELSEVYRAQGKFQEASFCNKAARQLLRFNRRQLDHLFFDTPCGPIADAHQIRVRSLTRIAAVLGFLVTIITLGMIALLASSL
jgi:tetratricopeptide (TPR) repeat protein